MGHTRVRNIPFSALGEIIVAFFVLPLILLVVLLAVWIAKIDEVSNLKRERGYAENRHKHKLEIAEIEGRAWRKWGREELARIRRERQHLTIGNRSLAKLKKVGERRGGVCLAFHPFHGWGVQTADGREYMADNPASAIHKATCDHTEDEWALYSVVVRKDDNLLEIVHIAPTEKEARRALKEAGASFTNEGPYSVSIENGIPEN